MSTDPFAGQSALAWTPEEEDAFRALSKRRDEAREVNLDRLHALMRSMGVGNWGFEDVKALAEHATALRAALAPFDSSTITDKTREAARIRWIREIEPKPTAVCPNK